MSEIYPDETPSDPSSASTIPPLPPPLKPVRSAFISSAVQFLADEAVKTAPLSKKIAFLKGKGLTQEEIDLALIKSNAHDFSPRDNEETVNLH